MRPTPAEQYEEQQKQLSELVPAWATKTDRNVKGAFTTGDFVEWQLNTIFGPGNWSVTILSGPTLETISEQRAYALATVRLDVRFADGREAHQDAVGVWPLLATGARNGGDLEETAPERYETVLKAAVTDGLKAAAERLGTCFRPLADKELKNHIATMVKNPHRGRPKRELVEEITGESETRSPASTPCYGDGEILDETNAHERMAYYEFMDRTGHVPPGRQELRDWWREQGVNGNGSAKPRTRRQR